MSRPRLVEPTLLGLRPTDPAAVPRPIRVAWDLLLEAGPGPDATGGVLPWGFLLPLLDDSAEVDPDLVEAAVAVSQRMDVPRVVVPAVRLESEGGFESPSFRIRATWTIPPGEPLDPAGLTGAWYHSRRGRDVLLSDAAWRLWRALQEPLPASTDGRLLAWAQVRPLASAVGAALDAYLQREGDVQVVDSVRPIFHPTPDGGLDVGLASATASEEQLRQAMLDPRNVLDRYTLRLPDGGRIRYIMGPQAQEGLRVASGRSHFSPDEAPAVLANPEAYFDPEVFDLSQYSDRVIGIGPRRYRPTVSAAIRSGDRQWADENWAEVRELYLDLADEADPEAAPLRIDIGTPESRERVRRVVSEAVVAGRAYAEVDGRLVRATPQLAALLSELPAVGGALRRPESLKGCVLLIHENVETLDYSPPATGSEAPLPSDWIVARPAALAEDARLMPHQERGLRWLAWLGASESGPLGGGLLADQMGLGKTVQILGLLARLADVGALRPSIVVAPASVLENWEREIVRFVPVLRGGIVRLGDVPRGAELALQRADVVLASYEAVALRDLELGRITWRLVVCDEAQKIKNPSTRAAQAVKALQAELRVAVTGTPVENSLDELWSIVDYFRPGWLGALREFRHEYARREILASESERDRAAERLRARLASIVLRRTREDVALGLPPIEVHRSRVGMSPLQVRLYSQLADAARDAERGATLARVQQMLQVCAHPFLLLPDGADRADPVPHAPKLADLLSRLRAIRGKGEKVLIFARWVRLQRIIAATVAAAFDTWVPVLNGGVPAPRRQEIIDRFGTQAGFGAMVLAPRACGVGLNIVAANHVFHYSREWNPAVEAQATDRVYRIGQRRPVAVYLPVTASPEGRTADEVLDEILEEKAALLRDFVRPTDSLNVGIEDFQQRGPNWESGPAGAITVDELRFCDPTRLLDVLGRTGGRSVMPLGDGVGWWRPLGPGRWEGVVAEPGRFAEAVTAGIDGLSGAGWMASVVPLGRRELRNLRSIGEVREAQDVVRVLRSLGVGLGTLLGGET